jgi:2'-5' RNA ligase
MRIFIAIKLTQNLKASLSAIQKILNKHTAAVKWVNPENIHITLRFIGNASPQQIEIFKKTIEKVAEQYSKFNAIVDGFGFFPNFIKARVFYLTLSEPEKITAIAKALNKQLKKVGLPTDKRFKPHLTLARLKNSKNAKIISENIKQIQLKQNIDIDNITLYQSNLTPRGAIHQELLSVKLNDSGKEAS